MTAPRIAVVVLNWNGRSHLQSCVPSVLASDYDAFDLIVVDNASEDDSVDWLRQYAPQATLVENPSNLRFAAGNNVGAKRAFEREADVVLLLNNDATLDPTSLSALAETFVRDESLGVLGSRIVYAKDPQRIWYGGGLVDWRFGRIRHRALRQRVDAGADPAGPTDWVTGCALAVRRRAWEELHGLDDDYYIYGEDADFCLRAARAGWKVAYDPRSVVRHDVSASVGGHWSTFKSYHKTRARWMLARRFAPHSLMLGPSLVAQDLALAGFHLFRGQASAAGAVLVARGDLDRGLNRHPIG